MRNRHKPIQTANISEPPPWWGDGEAPSVRWPGVTIDIACTWDGAKWVTSDGVYYFDADAAVYAEDFFPLVLKHHIGEWDGKPFELLPYQRMLVRTLFGWKRTADQKRRFQKVFLAVPKGSGKSPFGAGLGLFLAFFDKEAGSEVYAVAADRKQAGIVFDSAKVMVERNPKLTARCVLTRDTIRWRAGTEHFQVLSSDASTKHGFRPHGIIFDEFHAQPNRDLFDTLYRGMGKRRQPVLVMITTAGDNEESICFEEWEYARRVIAGTVPDDTYLPIIFELRPEEKWYSEAALRRVNPGYGITMNTQYFETEIRAAMAEPRKRNSFIQLHGNRWVNQATAWIPVEWWDACDTPVASDEVLKTLPCAAGLDLAQKYDLACFSVLFRHQVDTTLKLDVIGTEQATGAIVKQSLDLNYRVTLVPFFWIPENTMRQREREDGVPYSMWAEAGLVTPTEGDIIDYARIYTDITGKLLKRFPLLKQAVIGYDPAFATDIASKLRDLSGLQVFEVLQNYTHMSEPCQVFEALVKAKLVSHGNQRVLRNHVENVAIKRDDAGRIRPVKPMKQTKRIDGVVASIMAIKSLMAAPPPPTYQVYMFGGRSTPASPAAAPTQRSFVMGRGRP